MNKKVLVLGLILVLVLNIMGRSPALAQIKDVPADHWAYRAIVTLLNKGYVSLYEDNTFRGDQAVDRFAFALTLARILESIEVERVKADLPESDAELIRKLSLEFEEELALWYAEQEALKDDLAFTKQIILTAEDRIDRVIEAQEALDGRLTVFKEQVQLLEGRLETQGGEMGEYEDSVQDLVRALVELEKDLRLQEQSVQELENWAGEKSGVLASLQNKIEDGLEVELKGLEAELVGLAQRNGELEEDIRTLAVRLQRETQEAEQLKLDLQVLKTNLELTQEKLLALEQDEDLLAELGSKLIAERNAALIRENRLETQIKEIEEEFASYRGTTEKELKSSKTLTTIALALAAVGMAIAFGLK